MEEKGGGQRHEHRRHVVAQGSGGHGGVTVGFKQCDPVEADDRAGKSQQLPMRLDACPPKGRPAEIQQEQQEHCTHRTADKGNDGGGQVNIADKDADGAEGGDGNDEIQLGTVDGLHRTNLSWTKIEKSWGWTYASSGSRTSVSSWRASSRSDWDRPA